MLQEPPTSAYDLNFELLGYRVRVHWGFWIMAAILGWGWSNSVNNLSIRRDGYVQQFMAELDKNDDGVLTREEMGNDSWDQLSYADTNADNELSLDELRSGISMDSPGAPVLLGIWIAAVFFSILVHEMGHAIAFRYYGIDSHIVLYHFGGLAIPGSIGAWDAARRRQLGAQEGIVVSAAGPAFQLLLAALTIGVAYATHIRVDLDFFGQTLVTERFPSSGAAYALINAILFPSIFWALINLAPLLPLDGGQIMRNALAMYNVQQPTRVALMVSVGTGAVLGLYFMSTGNTFAGIMFFIFAANNWQAMQYGAGGF